MNELVLFGKAMVANEDSHSFSYSSPAIMVEISRSAGNTWRRVAILRLWGSIYLPTRGGFSSKELARDDAELALRELYAALGELVEPWITDRDPPPPACSTCDDAYLCSWDSEYGSLVGEAKWDGTVWYGDGHLILNKPYAWREMPKAPLRKGLE
jgi:hypothetical protein